jgi:hypothetical protein
MSDDPLGVGDVVGLGSFRFVDQGEMPDSIPMSADQHPRLNGRELQESHLLRQQRPQANGQGSAGSSENRFGSPVIPHEEVEHFDRGVRNEMDT